VKYVINDSILGIPNKEWVFIEHIVEISYLPAKGGFVVHRQYFQEVQPLALSFKPDHIFNPFLIGASKEHCWIVLVLDIHFHGRFNETGDSYKVWFMVWINVIQHMPMIRFGHIYLLRCSKHFSMLDYVILQWLVFLSFNINTMVYFCFKYFYVWLSHS